MFRGFCIAIQFVTRNRSVRSGLQFSIMAQLAVDEENDTSVSVCSVLHLAFWTGARRGGKFNPRYGNARCNEILLARLVS